MASFCTKCGAALDSGARFCTRCGAAAADNGAPAGSGYSAQPGGGVPATAPKSTSALKVVLIVVGVFVGLGILAGAAVIFGIWGLSRAVKVEPNGEDDRVTLSTPLGSVTAGDSNVTEAELGLPIYPGAEAVDGSSLQVGTFQGSMGSFLFRSSDPPEKVLDFYRDRLTDSIHIARTEAGGIITSAPSESEGYMITVGRDEENGYTMISVIRGITSR